MTKLRDRILLFLESDSAQTYGKIWEDSQTLNKCIRAFGLDAILEILLTSIQNSISTESKSDDFEKHLQGCFSNGRRKRPSSQGVVVSVGSGNGLLERILYDCYLAIFGIKLEVVCVDPNPLSFASHGLSKTFFEPSFATIDDLVASRPELVGGEGGIFLLLNWCFPTLSYDREAVEKLKPKTVFSTVELFKEQPGAAGSPEFFEWYQGPLTKGEKKVDFRLRGCTYDLRIFLRGKLGPGVKSLDSVYDSCVSNFDDYF
jgi:hypothetical protein